MKGSNGMTNIRFASAMRSFVVLFMLSIIVGSLADDDLDHLLRIWQENVRNASNWERPTASIEFKGFSNETVDYGKYDFVVVGAGSSGSIIASRLSENPNWKVLLIEAGDEETLFSEIPGANSFLLSSEKNWGYLTAPQTHACLEFEDSKCSFPTGKSLGGGSAINGMMYVRGNSRDFSYWNSSEWTFKKVLPYYRKLENSTLLGVDPKYRGMSGPIVLTYANPLPLLANTIASANKELGANIVDFNGVKQIGMGLAQRNIKNGKRVSSSFAYLRPEVRCRPNLTIFKKTLATKIVFKESRAQELLFLKDGSHGSVQIEKELIVSGGIVNSPQLLMLSGVGPANVLKKHEIPVVKNLPVGEFLSDQIFIALTVQTNFTVPKESFNDSLGDYLKGFGKLTYSAADEIRFFNMNPNSTAALPDLELIFRVNIGFDNSNEITSSTKLQIGMVVVLLHAKSHGEVTLNSTDPTEYPNVDPKYLTVDSDVEILYRGILEIRKLLETQSLRNIGATLIKPDVADCSDIQDEKKFWFCVIRQRGNGAWHAVSSCRLGNDQLSSVVNERLVVHGFDNLRVADASVAPIAPSGHTNAIAMMIGERTSDFVKQKYVYL